MARMWARVGPSSNRQLSISWRLILLALLHESDAVAVNGVRDFVAEGSR